VAVKEVDGRLKNRWGNLERKSFLKVLVIYFLVSGLVLASNLIPFGSIADIAILPGLLSVFLLVPLWIWHKSRLQKASLSKQLRDEPKRVILFWVLALFLLAMVVRIPSVLLFGMAYEKTPLIYLVVLSIVVLMRNDVSVFGFRTDNFDRALILGTVYYMVLGLLPNILIGASVYILTGQMLIEGFNLTPFLFAMSFHTFCVGISEEGLFRGYMQTRLSRVYGNKKAIFLQALLFGLWHFVWHVSPLDWLGMLGHIGDAFITGLLWGYFYGVAANITPLVLTHGLGNSVPEGFIQNQNAWATLQDLSLITQLLLLIVPYLVSWVLAFASTRFLIKTIMGHKESKTERQM